MLLKLHSNNIMRNMPGVRLTNFQVDLKKNFLKRCSKIKYRQTR